MRADYERYSSAVKRDADGNPLNGLSIDNFQLKDEKNMGVHLQGLAQRTDTHGQYLPYRRSIWFPNLHNK